MTQLLQNVFLLSISLMFLPFTTCLVFLSLIRQIVFPRDTLRKRVRQSLSFHPKTILVTGVSTTHGLQIARIFYETGHEVIGADLERFRVPAVGRMSKALKVFYRLERPTGDTEAATYIKILTDVVLREKVDLWINCASISTAVEDAQAREVIERKTACRCIQWNVETTSILNHTESLMQFTRNVGLPTPETYEVSSRDAVHRILHEGKREKKTYIITNTEIDASPRPIGQTTLPRRTLSQTYQYVSDLSISKKTPWLLQRYISGEEYVAFAAVVNGVVKVFVACPLSKSATHYVALPSHMGLYKAMMSFTQEFAFHLGSSCSGHLTIYFLVEERATKQGLEQTVLPFKGCSRAQAALINLLGREGQLNLTKAYLSALEPSIKTPTLPDITDPATIVAADNAVLHGCYWVGQDLLFLVLCPFWHLVSLKLDLKAFFKGVVLFFEHVFFEKEATYELWDPWPFWWLYHVYWPSRFLMMIWRQMTGTGKRTSALVNSGK